MSQSIQRLVRRVFSLERQLGNGADDGVRALYTKTVLILRKRIEEGETTGIRTLDTAFLLRDSRVSAFSTVLQAIESKLVSHIGESVVVYHPRWYQKPDKGIIRSSEWVFETLAHRLCLPTNGYEAWSPVQGEMLKQDGGISFGHHAAYTPIESFVESIHIGNRAACKAMRGFALKQSESKGEIVDVILIGTMTAERRRGIDPVNWGKKS